MKIVRFSLVSILCLVVTVSFLDAEEGQQQSSKEIGRDGNFIAYDNGTVLDSKTGLMWAAKDNGTNIKWWDAEEYCENYKGGGYRDWRLPTTNELRGLFDSSKSYQIKETSYTVHLTELIELTAPYLWASETKGSKAGNFNFIHGTVIWDMDHHGFGNRVLPVRSVN